MGKTRGQRKAIARAEIEAIKDDAVYDNLMNVFWDEARRETQKDLMFLGVDIFNKKAYFTGDFFNQPTDLMPMPKNIIALLCSNGVRASVTTSMAGSNNDIKFTAREPGTGGNSISVVIANDPDNVSVSVSGKTITVYVDEGTTTANQVITLIGESLTANDIISVAKATGNDGTGAVVAGTYALSGGTLKGWRLADKVETEKFYYLQSMETGEDYIQAPSVKFPKYAIFGTDVSTSKQIKILPSTILQACIQYYYELQDLADDDKYSGLPDTFEDLAHIKFKYKLFKHLKLENDVAMMKADYYDKLRDLGIGTEKQIAELMSEKKDSGTESKA